MLGSNQQNIIQPKTESGSSSQGDNDISNSASISPKEDDPIHGMREKFNVDLTIGSEAITIPIVTSPGCGVSPELALSHSSAKGNSVFGLWLGYFTTQHYSQNE